MTKPITPATLAELDRVIAEANPLVDQLVCIAAEHVQREGFEVAVGTIAASCTSVGTIGQIATVASISIARLAEQLLAEQERRAIAEDVHAERTADAADRGPEDRP